MRAEYPLQKSHATPALYMVWGQATWRSLSLFSFLDGAALISLLNRGVDSIIEDEWTRFVE
ncbi:hypothetical protein [Methanosphaerula subterraneus]|uniref:hypothetical protein n=1 Tax=Methanosphaerula subterraneus TaxID=3350244 RepID=UPI003F87406D